MMAYDMEYILNSMVCFWSILLSFDFSVVLSPCCFRDWYVAHDLFYSLRIAHDLFYLLSMDLNIPSLSESVYSSAEMDSSPQKLVP